jgi:hypothetical protein
MRLAFWGVGLAVLASACGSEVQHRGDDGDSGGAAASGGSGGSTTTGGAGFGPGKQPPAPPAGAGPGDGSMARFAATRLFLGSTDRNGAPNPTAWKTYGYDIDGRISQEGDPGLCQPAAGGSPKVHNDGDQGIDNAFGKSILPLMLSFANDFESLNNQALLEGEYTILIRVDTLGAAASYVDLPALYYEAAPLGSPPLFDGSDAWPITAESLTSPGDPGSSRWPFPISYLNEHTFVTSPLGSLQVSIALSGMPMQLQIEHAVLTMEVAPDRTTAQNGIISGVLESEVFADELREIAGAFSPELCEGTTVESLIDQIRATSDILLDGSQDPTQTCNGISIGLGFDAVAVLPAGVAAPVAPPPDPCAP